MLPVPPSRSGSYPPPPFEVRGDVSGVDIHAIGSLLVLVGLVGIFLLLLWLWWASPGHWPRRRTYVDEGSGGASYC